MCENAYLSIKNPKASRALKRALDPGRRMLTLLTWLCFAMSAFSWRLKNKCSISECLKFIEVKSNALFLSTFGIKIDVKNMHIWASKTQKLPGPLSGPWTLAAECSLCSRDSASLCRQLSASEAGAPPLDQILDPHLGYDSCFFGSNTTIFEDILQSNPILSSLCDENFIISDQKITNPFHEIILTQVTTFYIIIIMRIYWEHINSRLFQKWVLLMGVILSFSCIAENTCKVWKLSNVVRDGQLGLSVHTIW